MSLSGKQFGQIQEALIDAFRSTSDLMMMVRIELDENLNEITQGSNLTEDIFNLINWADANGRVQQLIEGACRRKAGNHQLSLLKERFNSIFERGKIAGNFLACGDNQVDLANTLTFHIAQRLMKGAKLILADHHLGEAESLSDRLEPMSRDWLFDPVATYQGLSQRVAYLMKIINGEEPEADYPIVLAATNLLQLIISNKIVSSNFLDDIQSLMERGTEFGISVVVAESFAPHETVADFVGFFHLAMVHRQSFDCAKHFLPEEIAKKCPSLVDHQAFALQYAKEPRLLVVPLCDRENISKGAEEFYSSN